MGIMLRNNQFKFTGRLGDMIVYYSRGKYLCRKAPDNYNDANSDPQKSVRGKLTMRNNWANKFFDETNKAIMKRGDKTMTSHNYFHHINATAFNFDENKVNYELLQFSVGELHLPEYVRFTLTNKKTGTVVLDWKNEEISKVADPDDRLRIIAIKDDSLVIIPGLTFYRKDEMATITIPWKKWVTVYLYAFFYDEGNKKSTKTCFVELKNTPATVKKREKANS
jgi:hypothetical protein